MAYSGKQNQEYTRTQRGNISAKDLSIRQRWIAARVYRSGRHGQQSFEWRRNFTHSGRRPKSIAQAKKNSDFKKKWLGMAPQQQVNSKVPRHLKCLEGRFTGFQKARIPSKARSCYHFQHCTKKKGAATGGKAFLEQNTCKPFCRTPNLTSKYSRKERRKFLDGRKKLRSCHVQFIA